jgi:hypothetical protein
LYGLAGSSPILRQESKGISFSFPVTCSIVFKVPQATSCTLDELHAAIEKFARDSGFGMNDVRENTRKVTFKHGGDSHDR